MELLNQWKKRDPLLSDMEGYQKFVEEQQAKQQIVKQFLENDRRIREIEQQSHEQSEQANDQVRQVQNRYYDKLKVLGEERDGAIKLIRDGLELERKEADREVGELSKVITKVQRILAFLRLKEQDLTVKDEDATVYHKRHIESLGYFYNDDYMKIKLFIAENDKPTNRFQLFAAGKCFFTQKVMDLREFYSYGITASLFGRCNIQRVIKEAPEILDLKLYLERQREKILADLIAHYLQVKTEYLDVKAKYTLEMFAPLMAYRCSNCGWFLTTREVNRWTRLDNKCPECEQKTLENLTRVKSV